MIKGRQDDFTWQELPEKKRKLISTSGSYGSSMKFPHSPDKVARRRAEVLFWNRIAGYRIGARFAFLKAQAKAKVKSDKTGWSKFVQNEVDINLESLSTAELSRVIRQLQEGDIRFVVGWPSVMRVVAEEALERGIAFSGVKGIVTMGEAVQETDRTIIENAFACRALNRYACMETGVLAHEYPGRTGLVVNRASYLIEVLRLGSDEPVRTGEAGRIVVTDLYSFAMPLIRYDTGDIGVVQERAAGSVVSLRAIDGRHVEGFFDTRGRSVLSMSVVQCLPRTERRKMWQFQFVQEGQGTYALNVVPGVTPVCEDAIVTSMQRVLGEDARVSINYLPEIPRLPSGKHALMVNKLKRGNGKDSV